MITELSNVEKALGKGDLAAQKAPLDAIVRALKPLRLGSIEQLEPKARGMLITTLLRVSRQPKPPPVEGAAPPAGGAPATPAEETPPAEASAPPAEASAPPAEASAPPTEAAPPSTEGGEPAAEAASPDAPPSGEATSDAPAAASAKPVDDKAAAHADVMYLVGAIWRAVGDERRAALAFAVSGRKVEQQEAVKTLEKSGDWREQAQVLEQQKRTRDAARIHEKNKSWAEAARLWEASGDPRAALRNLLEAKDMEGARRLLEQLKPEEAKTALEKAQAWELLMERYIAARDFDNVAKLYERARQFDQAGLAWEKAGKLGNARKAYERARDFASTERVRQLEVNKLVERGDRLGAALILVSAGKRERAVEVLTALPGPKAFRFLQRAKLDEEALALARKELAKADAEQNLSARARWLELTGEAAAAAEAWEKAGRKDRAISSKLSSCFQGKSRPIPNLTAPSPGLTNSPNQVVAR